MLPLGLLIPTLWTLWICQALSSAHLILAPSFMIIATISPCHGNFLVGGFNPSENIGQLGWLFPMYGTKLKCSNPPTSFASSIHQLRLRPALAPFAEVASLLPNLFIDGVGDHLAVLLLSHPSPTLWQSNMAMRFPDQNKGFNVNIIHDYWKVAKMTTAQFIW